MQISSNRNQPAFKGYINRTSITNSGAKVMATSMHTDTKILNAMRKLISSENVEEMHRANTQKGKTKRQSLFVKLKGIVAHIMLERTETPNFKTHGVYMLDEKGRFVSIILPDSQGKNPKLSKTKKDFAQASLSFVKQLSKLVKEKGISKAPSSLTSNQFKPDSYIKAMHGQIFG